MSINIDKIKEELYNTKKNMSVNLSTEEEEEINKYIESLVIDLQKKVESINIKILTSQISKYFKEDEDVK